MQRGVQGFGEFLETVDDGIGIGDSNWKMLEEHGSGGILLRDAAADAGTDTAVSRRGEPPESEEEAAEERSGGTLHRRRLVLGSTYLVEG